MNKIFRFLLASFFPERCPYCNKTVPMGTIACDECRDEFPETFSQNYAKGGYPCCSPFFYQGIFKDGVKRFKFKNHSESAEKLAQPIADCVKKAYDVSEIDIITFVPMFPAKESRRGYNQSKLLAKNISKLLDIPCEELIEKIKDNKPQHDCLSEAQRRDNVKGVYKVTSEENIKGKTILIIDDILTTGYTLGECCRLVERKSKAKVLCATLCAKNNIYT